MRAAINVVGWVVALAVAYLPVVDGSRVDALAVVVTMVCSLNLWMQWR